MSRSCWSRTISRIAAAHCAPGPTITSSARSTRQKVLDRVLALQSKQQQRHATQMVELGELADRPRCAAGTLAGTSRSCCGPTNSGCCASAPRTPTACSRRGDDREASASRTRRSIRARWMCGSAACAAPSAPPARAIRCAPCMRWATCSTRPEGSFPTRTICHTAPGSCDRVHPWQNPRALRAAQRTHLRATALPAFTCRNISDFVTLPEAQKMPGRSRARGRA